MAGTTVVTRHSGTVKSFSVTSYGSVGEISAEITPDEGGSDIYIREQALGTYYNVGDKASYSTVTDTSRNTSFHTFKSV